MRIQKKLCKSRQIKKKVQRAFFLASESGCFGATKRKEKKKDWSLLTHACYASALPPKKNTHFFCRSVIALLDCLHNIATVLSTVNLPLISEFFSENFCFSKLSSIFFRILKSLFHANFLNCNFVRNEKSIGCFCRLNQMIKTRTFPVHFFWWENIIQ